MSEKNESILLDGIVRKDSQAFARLYSMYHAALFRFSEAYVYDSQQAEDIIQEVFIKLWEMPTIPVERSLKSYLFQMVKNRCLDHLRSLQVEDKNKKKLFEAQAVSDSTDLELDEKSTAIIKNAIEQLPEQCKQVYLLAVFQNMKYQDIADELNISVSAVKVQMFRARKYLKENLSGLRESLSLFSLFEKLHRFKKF
ncbi:RNA polymerase sigma-70 factor [Mangrovibacterium diazotrophicum]|nr:RNA polymerase sigma-70 factor [Mangrovibacterium diazotrophicum]